MVCFKLTVLHSKYIMKLTTLLPGGLMPSKSPGFPFSNTSTTHNNILMKTAAALIYCNNWLIDVK